MYNSGVKMESSSTKCAVPREHNSLAAQRALIVCYGNPMRSDDGVAWRVAEHLAPRLDKASTELLCRVQLTPELADAMSQVDRVLFVDAAAGGEPGEIRWSSIRADEHIPMLPGPNFTHQSSPQSLLSLCRIVYKVAPETSVVTVSAASFELGEALTEKVETVIVEVAASIQDWLKNQPISKKWL